MTQEDKELLLKDLSARLTYKVKVCLYEKETCILTGIDGNEVYLNVDSDSFRIGSIKPYLRPMSSITEDEAKEFNELSKKLFEHREPEKIWADVVDWLNKHHFDYRGLIEKGLAIEVTKESNLYKK